MAENNLALRLIITAKDEATRVISNLKGTLTGFMGVAAAAAAAGFAAFLKGSVDEAEQLDAQLRKLQATIKATGGAAGLTANDIAQMFAGDDNAVDFRDAATQLLTFKSVGKDVFETTLRLADDLADAGFGTLASNAVQLGKALEDPVNGLSALTRSGVTFSDSQKALIKQLVETGDKARAQGIILDAVAGQVGGVADAVGSGLRGANESLDASFRQIRESVGGLVIPALTVFKSAVAESIGRLAEFVQNLSGATASGRAFGGVAQFLAFSMGAVTLAVDRVGRSVGAMAAKFAALATLDFSAIQAIDEAFQADNEAAVQRFLDLLDSFKEKADITVTPTIDTQGAQQAFDALNADVETVINQFRIWNQDSTDTVDNIAAELRKLSDVELQKLKTTLADAFEAGTNRSDELVRALENIKTEEVTRAWKTLGKESSGALQEAANAARAAYTTIRDSGTASAKDLETAWSAYIGKVLQAKTAISEVDQVERQRQQNLADLDAIGATAAEQSERRKRELTQQTIDFERAMNEGRLADAVRLAQEREALALDNARAEKQAFVDGEAASYQAYDARQQYLRSIEDTKKALAALSAEEQQAADQNAETADNGQALADQQNQLQAIQNLTELLKQPVNMQINGNFAEVLAMMDQLQQRAAALNAQIANATAAAPSDDVSIGMVDGLRTEVLKRGVRR